MLLVKTVGKRRRRGLVDDALHVEAGDLAGVLGSLALGVVEVGRNGDDRVGDRLAQVLLGVRLHLREDHGADLLGREVLALDLDHRAPTGPWLDGVGDGLELRANLVVAATHEALDREDRVLGVGDRLVLCGLTDDAVAVLAETDDGGCGTVALGVYYDGGLATLENRHRRVGGAQIDAQNLAHTLSFPLSARYFTCPADIVCISLRFSCSPAF